MAPTTPTSTRRNAPSPRPAIQPQAPARCPYCNSPRLAPKGTRHKKLESVAQLRCRACGRTFRPGPRAIRNKTYPVGEILDAITTFNRGYSLAETAARMASRYGHPVHPATISRWVNQHPELTTYRKLRDAARRTFSPPRLIRTTKLYHRQVYEFAYHRAKLALLQGTPLAAVARFLESIPTACPHTLFQPDKTDAAGSARGSQLAPSFLATDQMIVTERQNAATATAALVIPSVGTNHERHPKLQRFMLANDAATLAVEVPIWLTEEDLAALEAMYGLTLVPKAPVHPGRPDGPHWPRQLTGHIDLLQVRGGTLHVLDYKPDARTNQPIAQLVIYALALTRRIPGLRLFDIKCAWFNEHAYNEIFPRKLLPPARSSAG